MTNIKLGRPTIRWLKMGLGNIGKRMPVSRQCGLDTIRVCRDTVKRFYQNWLMTNIKHSSSAIGRLEIRLVNIGKRTPGEFAITEKPIPLRAWESEDGADLIAIIEDDLRRFMRQCAKLELTVSDKERQHTSKMEEFLLRLIEVLDSFEQLFQNISDKQDKIDQQTKIWIGNFRTIYRFLKSIIDEQGVIELEIIDWSFNPHSHRVIETVVDLSKPDGTIVRQTQKGYLWQDRIIRKAEVIVVRNNSGQQE